MRNSDRLLVIVSTLSVTLLLQILSHSCQPNRMLVEMGKETGQDVFKTNVSAESEDFQKQRNESKWPSNYTFDHELLENLTGHEEPLEHLKLMPDSVEYIGAEFRLYSPERMENKENNPLKENLPYMKDPLPYDLVHYNNESTLDEFPPKCKKLYMLSHGFTSSIDVPQFQQLIKNVIKYVEDACMIGIDWRKGAAVFKMHALVKAGTHASSVSDLYSNGAVNTIAVGRQASLILHLLVKKGKADPKNIHLMGHSLGAHVVHFAAQNFQKLNNGKKVHRLTGLDAASKEFEAFYPGGSINDQDAEFVDAIHTTISRNEGGMSDLAVTRLGFTRAIGHVDFYPNGGSVAQKDCTKFGGEDFLAFGCGHYIVESYMADTYDTTKENRTVFQSVECDDIENLEQCFKDATPEKLGSMGRDAEVAKGRGKQFLVYSRINGTDIEQQFDKGLKFYDENINNLTFPTKAPFTNSSWSKSNTTGWW